MSEGNSFAVVLDVVFSPWLCFLLTLPTVLLIPEIILQETFPGHSSDLSQAASFLCALVSPAVK